MKQITLSWRKVKHGWMEKRRVGRKVFEVYHTHRNW